MTMAMSKALADGSKAVVCASTGNTSAASVPLAMHGLLDRDGRATAAAEARARAALRHPLSRRGRRTGTR